MQPQDKLSIVTFARTARLWVDGVPGDQAGEVAGKSRDITPEGGTNLEDALNLAYKTAARHYLPDGINRVVLLTDGAANLGNVEPEALKKKSSRIVRKAWRSIASESAGKATMTTARSALSQWRRPLGFINEPSRRGPSSPINWPALHVAAADVKVQVEFNPAARDLLSADRLRKTSTDQRTVPRQHGRRRRDRAPRNRAPPFMCCGQTGGDGPLPRCVCVSRCLALPTTASTSGQCLSPGTHPRLEQASAALRLAGTAAAFSEMLANSQYATEVTSDRLLGLINGVPAIYGADPRPTQLDRMIRQAKNLSGR